MEARQCNTHYEEKTRCNYSFFSAAQKCTRERAHIYSQYHHSSRKCLSFPVLDLIS